MSAVHVRRVVDTDDERGYAAVEYVGSVRSSIDAAIHAAVYERTQATALLRVHDAATYEGLPFTVSNYAYSPEAERDAIVHAITGGSERFVVGLHKHGLLLGGASFDDCLNDLGTLGARLRLTPLSSWLGADVAWLLHEWNEHLEEVRAPAGTTDELERLFDQRGFRIVISEIGRSAWLRTFRCSATPAGQDGASCTLVLSAPVDKD
jgi:flavin-binding protein dodecin